MRQNSVPTSSALLENSCWADFKTPPNSDIKPCLFLDRDGVVVKEVNYLHRPEDVQIIDGALSVIHQAKSSGWLCGLVTNQAGIARGYYDWSDFCLVQAVIDEALNEVGAGLDFVLACPHHPEAAIPDLRHPEHPWRKPQPGMLMEVTRHFHIDIAQSILVGDQLSDIEAGNAAGIKNLYLVLTGHGLAQPLPQEQNFTKINSIADLPKLKKSPMAAGR